MYSARDLGNIRNEKGWDSHLIGIFEGEKQIGQYERNYSFLSTFYPFQKDSKWYALYSPHYTATRVMELPSCKDLGGEEPAGHGFCPVEFYVPQDSDGDSYFLPGHWGFVSGCVWGDDTSWKLQWLDLSEVEKGIVKREERFEYLELPRGRLKDLISIDDFRCIKGAEDEGITFEIATSQRFTMKGNEVTSYFSKPSWANKEGWGIVWPIQK